MRLRAPDFWYQDAADSIAFLLKPLGWMYGYVGRLRRALAEPYRVNVPVVCIGNLTAGGTGKTPMAMKVGAIIAARGLRVAFLSRGYGAHVPGAMVVDGKADLARDVGDEPLMLAQRAMTVVSPDRPAGARLAISRGAQVIIMDDGFQNPSLAKDLCFVVVDAARGFGNGCLIPAGPLRERVEDGLARADAVFLMGEGSARVPGDKPIVPVALEPLPGEHERLKGRPFVAFAGIGAPSKFFETAQRCGATLKATRGFADHHDYSEEDLLELKGMAAKHDARLLTTEKDWLRLPANLRAQVEVLRVEAQFRNPTDTTIDLLIDSCLKKFHPPALARH